MITTINNKHNKLNVPNKREQNQTCLDSAEREGLRPKGKNAAARLAFIHSEREFPKPDAKVLQFMRRLSASVLFRSNLGDFF